MTDTVPTSQILLTRINMILLTPRNYSLYFKYTHIHKAAKPSNKANEVQIIPVLSVGKIQNHILYFLCSQKTETEILCAHSPSPTCWRRTVFPSWRSAALEQPRRLMRSGERSASPPALRFWPRQLFPFFARTVLQ